MDSIISFTPAQLGGWILALCAAVVSISKALDVLGGWRRKARQPEAAQDERIRELTQRIDKVERKLDNDKHHLDALDSGSRVTQQALLALLGHAIDGNNTKQLADARDDLYTYLVERPPA